MKIDLIKPYVSRFRRITTYILIGLIIGAVISSILEGYDKPRYFTIIFLSLFFILFIIKMVRSFMIKEFNNIGFVNLGSETISLETIQNQCSFKLGEIRYIEIKYEGYEGEDYPLMMNGAGSSSGQLNFIRISTSREFYTYRFFLGKRMERANLFKHLRYYEKSGVKIRFKNDFGGPDIYKKL